ncbi:MAG: hypothetical protein EBZ47_00230 [Chlamydiae bacterium]|nr:hypothetical protein [Chlamydiota bacterium]
MTVDSFVNEACVVLSQDMERLGFLVNKLKETQTWYDKHELIAEDVLVQEALRLPSFLKSFLAGISIECAFVLKAVIAIGQADRVLDTKHLSFEESISRYRKLIDCLLVTEEFYKEIGGVVGYHLSMIQLLCAPDAKPSELQVHYLPPEIINISEYNEYVKNAVYHAIENMGSVAEIYPVGGAADRLKLYDPVTNEPLPAAKLSFCGSSLLKRLISDVQAKEYLYFKLYQKQIEIPIALMTSKEKDNDVKIQSLFEENHYFHRSKEGFFFFCQPLVPTINQEGKWGMKGALEPLLRPGGHGVIWKLARDSGCFDWLKKKDVHKALVRQINNPVAAEDYSLLAFAGVGLWQRALFGFCSCPRLVKSAEGTNVLVEQKMGDRYQYTLTNIEYCDFSKYGIADEPWKEGSNYSKFPSNTNLLFIDIDAIHDALKVSPIPGMLVNLKKISYVDEFGDIQEEILARLESMMQNIADCFMESYAAPKEVSPISLPTYITFNERTKTISTTKKEYALGASLIETPEGCFIDMMHNAKKLLSLCNFEILKSECSNVSNVIFLYHPALGPLYSIIAQKMRQGFLFEGSELVLNLSELYIENLSVQGSLTINAENIMGHQDSSGKLVYSNHTGKCTLKNVKVSNRGIDYNEPCVIWKSELHKIETCLIEIQGDGEFFAEGVVLEGNLHIVVPPKTKVTAKKQGKDLLLVKEVISTPTWQWDYTFDQDKSILLIRSELKKEFNS